MKVPEVTWRCLNWMFELQPYCIMSAARTQSTWLKWPFWFKQSLANSPRNWTLSSFIVLKWQFPLLAGNCLPYHQSCPYNPRSTSVLELTWFYAHCCRECWSLLAKKKEHLKGLLNNLMFGPEHLALVATLVQTITCEFLKWTRRDCLFIDCIGVIIQLLARNCLSPSTLSYNPQPT